MTTLNRRAWKWILLGDFRVFIARAVRELLGIRTRLRYRREKCSACATCDRDFDTFAEGARTSGGDYCGPCYAAGVIG